MSSSDLLQILVIIKFCYDLGKTPTQKLKMIEQTKREHLVSRAPVFKWYHTFAYGRDSLEEHEGRAWKKKKLYGAMIVTSIREAQLADSRTTIRELIERFYIDYDTMYRILTEDLQMSKVILSYKFDF